MEVVNKILEEYLNDIQEKNDKIKKENVKIKNINDIYKNKYYTALSFSILEWLILILILIKLFFNI